MNFLPLRGHLPLTLLMLHRVRTSRRPRDGHSKSRSSFGGKRTLSTRVPLGVGSIMISLQFWEAGKIVSAVCHGPALALPAFRTYIMEILT